MENIIALLLAYKYLILLPLAIVEGPIITIVAGFLVTTGVMNPLIVYAVVILGDVIGDTFCYGLGLWGHKILNAHGHYLGATPERLAKTKELFENHHHKAVSISKLTHGIGFIGLITAGSLKLPYLRFIKTCVFITLLQSAIILAVGILFGHAYLKIGKYLDYYAAGATVTILAALFIFAFYKFKVYKSK